MRRLAAVAAVLAAFAVGCGGQSSAPATRSSRPAVTHATFRSGVTATYAHLLGPVGWPHGSFPATATKYDDFADRVALAAAPADEEDIKRELVSASRQTARDFRTADKTVMTGGFDQQGLSDDVAAVRRIIHTLPPS